MFLFITVFVVLLSGCQTEVLSTDETISCTGDLIKIYNLNDTIDVLDGITCTSSTRGDITDLMETTVLDGDILSNEIQQVVLVRIYTTYENDDLFEDFVRITVRNPDLDNPDDLLFNHGGFNGESILGHAGHADFPDDMWMGINPDLNLMQFTFDSVSENDDFPMYYFDIPLTLNMSSSYTISMLVRGTEATSFRVNIIEFNEQENIKFVETTTVVPLITVPVTTSEELVLFTYTFTPVKDTTTGIFRIVFGSSGSVVPSGEIHIDNITVTEDIE
jgi:hypothetical protein